MAELKFRIYIYDKAMTKLLSQIMDGFTSLDPLFGKMPHVATTHAGPVRNVRGPVPLDQDMPRIEAGASLSFDTIRSTNFEDYTRFLHEMAVSSTGAVAREFFRQMEEITNATGNTVDAGGKPFSCDLLNDMLETIQVSFDEHGKPVLPTMIVNPVIYSKVKDIKPTAEQEQRMSDILARKKAEYNAQKRTRRLS